MDSALRTQTAIRSARRPARRSSSARPFSKETPLGISSELAPTQMISCASFSTARISVVKSGCAGVLSSAAYELMRHRNSSLKSRILNDARRPLLIRRISDDDVAHDLGWARRQGTRQAAHFDRGRVHHANCRTRRVPRSRVPTASPQAAIATGACGPVGSAVVCTWPPEAPVVPAVLEPRIGATEAGLIRGRRSCRLEAGRTESSDANGSVIDTRSRSHADMKDRSGSRKGVRAFVLTSRRSASRT